MPVHHRLRFLTFPMRASRLCRPLRFRRVPFGRDVAFDPGGATASRIAMPHILPSTVPSVSASATFFLSWLTPHPIRSLCTLRIRRRRRLRNTRFPAARYHLTGAGLSPAGTRQLHLTHRNWKFESSSLLRRVTCELILGVVRVVRQSIFRVYSTGYMPPALTFGIYYIIRQLGARSAIMAN